MIVEEAQPLKNALDKVSSFDQDLAMLIKNWHLNKDGSYYQLSQKRYAARQGTPGLITTVNGNTQQKVDIIEGQFIRLRLVNSSNTVQYKLNLSAALNKVAKIVAIDANPVDLPLPVNDYYLAVGMRIDITFIVPFIAPGIDPSIKEKQLTLNDRHKPLIEFNWLPNLMNKNLDKNNSSDKNKNEPNVRSIKKYKNLSTDRKYLPVIPNNPIMLGDIHKAERISMVLEWDAVDDKNGDPVFWKIKTKVNSAKAALQPELQPELQSVESIVGLKSKIKSQVESSDMEGHVKQIAEFKLGKSYLVTIKNNTQYPHPVHFHGHTFKVLNSNKYNIQPYLADTVLLQKNEQAQILIYADNPGMWMFHCHIIEHMAMGLMGLVKVS
ncbi:MAG: multicopper oxidase domain-containing protein [Pseudomonadales bacterium]|nr:multicopper oxidase domain-containing protein [Pseudomonadales bacterium]